MQKVVIEEPYRFIAPHRGRVWSWAFRWLLPWFLRTRYGIVNWNLSGLEHLRASLAAGHGILLCPNHPRLADPVVMGVICREVPCHIYAMASWHLFKQSRLDSFIIRRYGGFSIYREGVDRQALDTAIDIVATAERPLVVFPEGVVSSCNDRLLTLMDGVSFVARMAVRKRRKQDPDGRVMLHPVSLRYRLQNSLDDTVGPILSRLERQTFWKSHEHKSVRRRINQLATALLSAREIECLGNTRAGDLIERSEHLLNRILHAQESEYLGGHRSGDVVARVKDLRSAMLPELLAGTLSAAERNHRWRQLTDSYYAQCLSMYPREYLTPGARGPVTAERVVEMVLRLEEDMTDQMTVIPAWHVDIQIGEPIEVESERRRSRQPDPLMTELRSRMLDLLGLRDWWPPDPVRKTEFAAKS